MELADGNALRILVLEDGPEVRARLARELESLEDVSLALAARCSEGMALVETQPFDAALLDLSLPDGSGLQVLRALKRRSPSCTAVVLTNLTGDEVADRCRASGADHYFDKTRGYEGALEVLRNLSRRGAA
jgi:CheY-like chemotaxis protein